MKVLHVHNVAHVPITLCKALRAAGVEADFAEEVSGASVSDYDIVHVHYAVNRKSLAGIRAARRLGKPVVLHHHGSDVRQVTGSGMAPLPFWRSAVSGWARKRSDWVVLATPDLIRFCPSGTYVPNPVDTEMFRPTAGEKLDRVLICGRQVKGSRLMKFIDPARQYDSINTGLPLKLPSNVRVLQPVPRAEFPAFLNRYPEMMGAIGDLVTMARMEAMACSLKTFSDFDESYVKFYDGENPDRVDDPRAFVQRHHDSQKVARKVIDIYEEILKA
ncbi:MAG: glycosyltransferase [Methanobacteriota archaeon]